MASDIQIFNDVEVKLVRYAASDSDVVQAARVSVTGQNDPSAELGKKDAGLINYLIRERHGTPFESNSMTFYVKAPIVVAREFVRHRIGVSINEMSGRYTVLPNEFYIPDTDRKLQNIGSSAHPEFAPGTVEQIAHVQESLTYMYQEAWEQYQGMIAAGIANEVARFVLPVGIMTQWYATFNARSLMSFLSLRTIRAYPEATFPSRPQREIEMVADKMEQEFARLMPVTHAAYNGNGRVAP